MQPEFKQRFFPKPAPPGADRGLRVGFRSGNKGTHTSRTIMLEELAAVLEATDASAKREDYMTAIVDANCLAKPTTATRRLTNQRLGELYALDPTVPIFRILRHLWTVDQTGRPLLALLVALARDPLLRATAPAVLSLPTGGELRRDPMREALRSRVGERLNDSTLNKVVRNASSSWTQSGHLVGRTYKTRQTVQATPAALAVSLYLAYEVGFRGEELLSSRWVAVLDCSLASARDLALEAKRQGIIDLRIAGDVWDLRLERLDPWVRSNHGSY